MPLNDIPEQESSKVRPPPNVINVPFASAWSVVTPVVFRYEDQKWIDDFFESGKLRLSTFSKFATYADEMRGDTNEGQGVCYGKNSDNMSIFLSQAQGTSAAVLCCSHRLDQGLRVGFKRESAFQITNTFGFALQIARQLAGFRHGMEGSCIYRADASISRAVDIDFDKYKLPEGGMDMKIIFDLAKELGGPELVLLKRKHYEKEQEYRLLWELDAITGDYVDVVAPLARQFCRRIEPEEWGE